MSQATRNMAVKSQGSDPSLIELTRRIGTHVRSLRRVKGLSRKSLSENSGVSERYLAQLETGCGNVSIGILHRLSLVFGCAVESLVAGGKFSSIEKGSRVALLGMRGGGKTTLGKIISSNFSVKFIEISKEIVSASGMSVAEVISLYGQEGFRRLERDAIAKTVSNNERVVIGVGGGIVETPENYEYLLRHFHCVWVKATPAEHIDRVRNQGDERPLRGFTAAEEHLSDLIDARETKFARSDFLLSTEGVTVNQSSLELKKLIIDNALL